MTFDRMGKRTVTVTLTVAQAEAIRKVCNTGIMNGDESAWRDQETARRGIERILIVRGYKPQRIAGMVGFATIDGKGTLS